MSDVFKQILRKSFYEAAEYAMLHGEGWTTSSATTYEGHTLTIEDIERAMRKLDGNRMPPPKIEQQIRGGLFDMGGSSRMFGVPIVSSLYATMREPARKHKKRRNQSASYHARIQKKWSKRFGTVEKPSAFVIGSKAFSGLLLGSNHRSIVAHPSIVERLRNEPI